MSRRKGLCTYCDRPFRGRGLRARTLDHVLPRHRGGTADGGNGVAACFGCNNDKGGLLISEWLAELRATNDFRARIVERFMARHERRLAPGEVVHLIGKPSDGATP